MFEMKNSLKYDKITVKKFKYLNLEDTYMKVSYNGLWKILIDKGMNKKELKEKVGIAPATVAKMGRGELVSMEILFRIGKELDVDFGDMVSILK